MHYDSHWLFARAKPTTTPVEHDEFERRESVTVFVLKSRMWLICVVNWYGLCIRYGGRKGLNHLRKHDTQFRPLDVEGKTRRPHTYDCACRVQREGKGTGRPATTQPTESKAGENWSQVRPVTSFTSFLLNASQIFSCALVAVGIRHCSCTRFSDCFSQHSRVQFIILRARYQWESSKRVETGEEGGR